MKNFFKLLLEGLLYFILTILILCSLSAFGQKITAKELAERNEKLEYLLLDYKQQLIAANKKIAQLTQENQALSFLVCL